MKDTELIALATLVLADAIEVWAANEDRKVRGEAMAYSGWCSDHSEPLRAELLRRQVLQEPPAD